jgi:penicillin amidase
MRPPRAQRNAAFPETEAPFDEREFLAMQLDPRAHGYELLREIVLEVDADGATDVTLAPARATVAAWNGRADPDQAGFDLLHRYYLALLDRALAPLLLPAAAADASFVYRWPLADEPLRRLLEERPAHLLVAGYSDWAEFLRTVLRDSLRPGAPGTTWGEVNRLRVAHPLGGLPIVGRWLALPDAALPGSMVSLRVAAPSYGAVIRMAVAPGEPEAGILQMAGGQSGHFLSPNFADLTADWLDGTPTPFLAGPTVDSFRLLPDTGR